MCGKFLRGAMYAWRSSCCGRLPAALGVGAKPVDASGMRQYSSGVVLQRLFEPNLPEWRLVVGARRWKSDLLYEGAQAYRGEAGPVFNIRYYDYAFASSGEGFGVNLLIGDNYRAGVALAYDLGRRVSDDYSHLRGYGRH